jgi:hypothetical protein
MHYDLGYFDLEQKTLQPLDNPFGTRLSPMSWVRGVAYVSGPDKGLYGGESVQISIYRPRLHTFADIQETPAPVARAVRRASRAFAPIREQSSRKYGLEYGRKRSTEGWYLLETMGFEHGH